LRTKALWVSVLAMTLVHCDDHVLGDNTQAEVQCDHEPPLTYENFGDGFLRQHCNGCHSSYREYEWQRSGAPGGIDFDTWDTLLEWSDRVQIRTEQGTMPPSGGPTAEERSLFLEWMACEVLPEARRVQ